MNNMCSNYFKIFIVSIMWISRRLAKSSKYNRQLKFGILLFFSHGDRDIQFILLSKQAGKNDVDMSVNIEMAISSSSC